jgi:hypothetical protein
MNRVFTERVANPARGFFGSFFDYSRRLNSIGVVPAIFLKAVEKWLWLANPVSSAISTIG